MQNLENMGVTGGTARRAEAIRSRWIRLSKNGIIM
jgi:hypothetical protein